MRISLAGWVMAAGLLLAASPVFATTLAVGTCESHYTSFATIQAAVNAAPLNGTTTILVCPGTYPEQVQIIGKAIVLKGVAYGNSNAAIITAPVGGMVENATSTFGGGIEAQVLVQNTTATVEYLTMDSSGSNLQSLGCNADPVGIFFQNASGTITRNSVLNDSLPADLAGCQGGLGIYVESGTTSIAPNPSPAGAATVSITYNNVANYNKNGITANGTGATGTISDNTVIGYGATNGAGQNSIQIAFGAVGTISSNVVGSDVWAPDVFGDTGDAAAGILVGYGSEGITINANNVSNTQYGIATSGYPGYGTGNGATITNNTISMTHLYDAIDLCASNSTATGNKINGADESGIHSDDTCFSPATGNSITGNTINSACAGVLTGPTGSAVTSPNTYYNVASQVMTGSDTCTPALFRKGAEIVKTHGRLRPAMPTRQ